MPLPILAIPETPQQRTCAYYKVNRLSMYPYIEMNFTETVTEIVIVTVISATDEDDDQLFETLVPTVQYSALPSTYTQDWTLEIVGKTLLHENNSVFGVCASVLEGKIVLVEGVVVDPTEQVLHYVRVNGFGEIVSRPSAGGKSTTTSLSARVPAHLVKMQEVLGSVAFNLVSEVLNRLGLSATPQEIGGALMAMAAVGDNLDSYIVRELENLQESVDADELPDMD